jgi:hypothetical protein
MAETGFKHIAVTAAEEDDFVIRAGVSDQHEPEPEPEEQEETESADSAEMVVDEKTEPEVESKPKPAPARKPAAKKKDTYHETTLEDLNSTQMPLAQKIVIAAAIVCIIGAVIYYFAFLR